MKATLKSLLPSFVFLGAAVTFAAAGWSRSSSAPCETSHLSRPADACCAEPQPAHTCCDTNAPAQPHP